MSNSTPAQQVPYIDRELQDYIAQQAQETQTLESILDSIALDDDESNWDE